MNIYQKLLKIQTELEAPKGQYNDFGKYNYRSTEDILGALKPLLLENNVIINITDEIVQIGDRYYVKVTATLIDVDDTNYELAQTRGSIKSIAYAREDEVKKGMDLSQVTGSTSSYARKYALNGLFAIDDTKDSDATNIHDKGQGQSANTQGQVNAKGGEIKYYCSDCGVEVTQAVHSYSTNKLGKSLCRACQSKAK